MAEIRRAFECPDPAHRDAHPFIACGICRTSLAPLEAAIPTMDVPKDTALYDEAWARLVAHGFAGPIPTGALWVLIDYGMALATAGRVRLEEFRK